MQLVIVESPTKARKLAGYLGKGYEVKASVGHVRDLPKSKLGVDLDSYEPTYAVSKDKSKVIKELRQLAEKADQIYLATDPDREGEAIAWHVKHILTEPASGKKKSSVKDKPFYRAVFHEITKKAVLKAIENPGTISSNLVDAQQARRVVDRLVGYQISPVLWKKIRRGLSAGRVQSVALRLIVEREREIEAFNPEEYWEVDVALNVSDVGKSEVFIENKLPDEVPDNVVIARVVKQLDDKYEPTSEKDVAPVVKDLESSAYVVSEIEQKERRRSSPPPFTTSTLQQAAANRLNMTSKQTMRLAQQLYEEGLITYHRTDSMSLSSSAIAMAREYIQRHIGQKYLPEKPRLFKAKSKNAQEAHEAIRVTDVLMKQDAIRTKAAKLTPRHAQLYDLIWRRFVASQMEAAVYDQTSIMITAKPTSSKPHKKEYTLKTNGSVLRFDGWLQLTSASGDTILPDLSQDQDLFFMESNAAQKFTQPPPRFNDASLVKELEKRGIGRPSTYASIISVIEDRAYVERDNKRFLPTAIGTTVNDFLVKHFESIMDYDFTAEMEDDLDQIAAGKKEWKKVVKTFYQPLDKKIEDVTEHAERAQIPVEKTGETCPQCGKTDGGEIVLRTGRYGKFKSCSRYPDCNFTENYVEKLADTKCPLCQQGDVIIKNTRWGKQFYGCERYPECDWASWKKPEPGLKLTQAEWDEMKAKREARKAKRQKSSGKTKTAKSAKTAKSSKSAKTTKKTTKKTVAKKRTATKKKTSSTKKTVK